MQLTDSYFQSSISHFFIRFIWEIKFSGLFISFLYFISIQQFRIQIRNQIQSVTELVQTSARFCANPDSSNVPDRSIPTDVKSSITAFPSRYCMWLLLVVVLDEKGILFLFCLVDVKALAAVDCKSCFGLRCKSSWCCWCCYSEVKLFCSVIWNIFSWED